MNNAISTRDKNEGSGRERSRTGGETEMQAVKNKMTAEEEKYRRGTVRKNEKY